jgi:branched-chain amino acid aminotransferase
VPGRQTALDLLKEANVRTVIGKVSPDELRRADEAFITSTAGGILPVTRVDHRPVGDGEPGPLTLRLKDRYWEKHVDPAETTPVDYD